MKIDRDREQELATSVQVTRGALLNLLTPAERKTIRHEGSTDPETFEDVARELADNTTEYASPRARLIAAALQDYQNAINTFWTLVQENGIAGYLTATWRRKHMGYAWIDRETLECEVLFQLRHFIGLFKPNNGNLADYALRGVHQHLTEFAAKQGPIEVPQKAGRAAGAGPDSHRRGIDTLDEQPGVFKDEEDNIYRDHTDGESLSYDPWDLINARLDGEIDDDDL